MRQLTPSESLISILRLLIALQILAGTSFGLFLRAHFVQTRDHVVVKRIEVPGGHQESKYLAPDANETTKVCEQVQNRVSGARVLHPIHVHLNRDAQPSFVLPLIGKDLLLGQREQVLIHSRGPLIQIEYF